MLKKIKKGFKSLWNGFIDGLHDGIYPESQNDLLNKLKKDMRADKNKIKLRLDNINGLKAIINGLKINFDELELKFDKNGLHMYELNRGHTLFATVDLSPKYFTEYCCNHEYSFIIDAYDLYNILSVMGELDHLEITNNENDLIISIIGESKKEFTMKSVNIKKEPLLARPDIKFIESVELNSEWLKDEINVFNRSFSNAYITLDEDHFIIKSDNDDFKLKSSYLHSNSINSKVNSKFGLDYLYECLKLSDFSDDNVRLNMGVDIPLELIYVTSNKTGRVSFLIAPKIE